MDGWNYHPRESVPGQLMKSVFQRQERRTCPGGHFANVNITCTYIRMREPGKQGAYMNESRAERLLRTVEGVAYWAVGAPVVACLPAALGYRVACWRGDWDFRSRHWKRAALIQNLGQLLGDELGPGAAEELTRSWFRFASCEAIDVMRLRGRARALRRLVEVRGREHLDAALAVGKGAILCSAHFGSYDCAFSVLGASGFPVTTVGRWQHNYTTGLSSAERRFWGPGLCPADTPPPAQAEHRAVGGPGRGRGASSGRPACQ